MDSPPGSLLAVARWRDRSVVTRARSVAPLRLLAPASRGHAAWVYQSSLGGGFVGADSIDLDVEVEAGARLFLTSQASSKVYRRAVSRARLTATVRDDGVLIAWPDPIACFAGAAFDQRQRFCLAASAGAIVVDAWTCGRLAHGERWAFERLALRTEIEIAGAPVVADALVVSAAHGELASRMGDARAFATILVAGPPFAATAEALGKTIAARPLTDQPSAPLRGAARPGGAGTFDQPSAPLRGAARPGGAGTFEQPRIAASVWPWGAVVRLAAATTEQLVAALHAVIGEPVRSALGADPFIRKW